MVFNPETTQKVILKAKEETTLIKRALATAHKTLPVYFCYLVGLSVTLQSAIPDLAEYIPDKLRHWVIGVATVIVFADKIVRSRPQEK